MDRRWCCRYNINCDPHSDEMQNVHRTNAGNAAKLNRLRVLTLKIVTIKMKQVYHCCKTIFLLARQRSRICLMNKHISFTVKIKTPVHEYI